MRTMLKELAKRGNAVTLLYSVRAAAEAAFLQELARAAQASGGRIQLHTTVTGRDDAWAGHKGRIDAAYIKQRVITHCWASRGWLTRASVLWGLHGQAGKQDPSCGSAMPAGTTVAYCARRCPPVR